MTWLNLNQVDLPVDMNPKQKGIQYIVYMTKIVVVQYPNGDRYVKESKSWEVKGQGQYINKPKDDKVKKLKEEMKILKEELKKPKKDEKKIKLAQAEDLGVEEI
jgi:hypothetical protein